MVHFIFRGYNLEIAQTRRYIEPCSAAHFGPSSAAPGDTGRAEHTLRDIALGRNSWLFSGSDCGGKRALVMYTLIGTARLNNVYPQA